eukprot:gene131-133_t
MEQGSVSPKDLSALSIGDTRCARAFLGSEDDCAYVPYELNVLDGLGELQQDLKLRLEAEQREHAVDLQLFAHLKEETATDSDFVVPGGQVQTSAPEVMGRIERRWEGLRERVEAKLQTLKGVDRRQESRLLDQAAKAGTVAKRVTWLRKAADSVTGSAAPAEALVIAKETGAPMNPLAGKYTMANVDEDSESYKAATQEAFGKPCTFLKDDDALLCQLVEGSTINVPYLNTQEHHVDSVVILGAHQDYDDIRNWFPMTEQQ